MALGSLTSLGVGSGFDLQKMLDQFRTIDEQNITLKNTAIEKVGKQIVEYDAIKTKILTIKSHALSLSLESSFIERSALSSKEDIVTATAVQGASVAKNTIEVTKLAEKSSFQSATFESEDSVAYGPLIEKILTGQSDANTQIVISEDQPLEITYDSESGLEKISINLTSGMTLDDVVAAVNTATDNQAEDGGNHVTAATFQDTDGTYGIRMTYPAPEKTFSYKLGPDGATIDVKVVSGTTLSQLASLINSDQDNPGVTATIIDTGIGSEPYRMVLQANESGEDSRITLLSQLGTAPLTEANGAEGANLNAELTVNGIDYHRQSNTGITDIIQGVTLDLKDKGQSTVDVTGDTETIKTSLMGIVEAFSDLVKEIKVNSVKDEETDEEGLLSNAYQIKSITNQVSNIFASIINTGGEITSFLDLGLNIDLRADVTQDAEGNKIFNGITLNEETLDKALSLNFNMIKNLFIGDSDTGITGLGDILNNAMRDMTATTGPVNSVKSTAQIKVETLQKTIEKETERLDKRYDIMAKSFVRLDAYIGKMNAQNNYLTSMFNSFNDSNNK